MNQLLMENWPSILASIAFELLALLVILAVRRISKTKPFGFAIDLATIGLCLGLLCAVDQHKTADASRVISYLELVSVQMVICLFIAMTYRAAPREFWGRVMNRASDGGDAGRGLLRLFDAFAVLPGFFVPLLVLPKFFSGR